MTIDINPDRSRWQDLCARPADTLERIGEHVRDIIDTVRRDGDAAVESFTARFDGVTPPYLVIPPTVLDEALRDLPPDVRHAITVASHTIRSFHAAQARPPVVVRTVPGVVCRLETRPLSAVGIYIPGGSAPLVSTVLMLAIPARLAGVGTIVLATPPSADGLPDRTVLAAARLCGVDTVVCAGGAQAIAAMAYGTERIPSVRLIAGPGNAWVTAAKQVVSADGIAIDMPAGPSEVLVLADDGARAEFIAADLLAQAEHGIDSQVMLVTTSARLYQDVNDAIQRQLAALPRRAIAERALENSRCVVFDTMEAALDFTNAYAPEHLIIMADGDEGLSARIATAGSIFLGEFTPESLGDYASGTNHTLPTGGWAAVASGVTLDTFRRTVTVQRADADGLARLSQTVVTLARAEGLEAHAQAVLVRSTGTLAYTPPTVLHANEVPNGVLGAAIGRYPDPSRQAVLAALSDYAGVPTDTLAVGNGSDELIDLVVRTSCRDAECSIVLPEPTFIMYRHAAQLNGTRVIPVPPRSGRWWNVDDVLAAVEPSTALILLCSPNNPVGYGIPAADVIRLLEKTTATIVVDEAYVEFSDAPSLVPLAATTDRLIVLRTLSKAWGLASLRFGWMCATPQRIATIRGAQAPFTNSEWTLQAVEWALRTQHDTVQQTVADVRTRRETLLHRLQSLPCVEAVEPSQANFLLVRFRSFEAVCSALEDAAVLVRDRSAEPGCDRCLRISIGTSDELQRLITILEPLP